MKTYDAIAIGTGSAMNIVNAISRDPKIKIAVVDKDDPGGICLTRACIPTKILLYPAELIRMIEKAEEFGINAKINGVNFSRVMGRMRSMIDPEIEMIRRGLSSSPNIDYYKAIAEFVAPYTLRVGDELITSELIFLCTGSKPFIPNIKGLEGVSYYTSDSILRIDELPKSLAIIGGGYVAAEYGYFFASMGTRVTVIGRNPQFLPQEEAEISAVLRRELSKYMNIITNHEVIEVVPNSNGSKKIIANSDGKKTAIVADEILLAVGRASNSDILKPKKGGIKTDKRGWILVNEYLETSQPNVWAFGDAIGGHLFKHVANYESRIVYYNAILGKKVRADYHAVPHAIFTYPEVASVGMGEKEAIKKYGKDEIFIGFRRFEDVAKGEAMSLKNYFVKVIMSREDKILGAHIIGPYASILIQEIVNLMYTKDQTPYPIIDGMHIHPSLSEVVEGAFYSVMDVDTYHHMIKYQLDVEV
jgi:dihydrolipoamide dehydrogenase